MYIRNLAQYNRDRSSWYYAAGERRAKPGVPAKHACTKCAGQCNAGSEYRTYSKSVGNAEKYLLCPALHRPELSLPKLDRNGRELDEKVPFKLSPERCYNCNHNPPAIPGIGGADDHGCGYRWRFKDMHVYEVNSKVEGGTVPARGCPVEATNDPYTWNEFQNISRTDNANEDEPDSFIPEWLPVHGTRGEFLYRLRSFERTFLEHKYPIRLDRQMTKIFVRNAMHRRALGTAHKDMPVTAHAQTDFAARMPQPKIVTATCAFPETSSNDVWVVGHSPFLQMTSDLPAGRRRKRLEKQKITQQVRQQVTVVFAFSKVSGDAGYHATVMADLVHILNFGTVPVDSGLEWFYNRERLLGGNHSKALGFDLRDADVAHPIAVPAIESLRVKRDGCAKQYQGKGNFRNTQTFRARTGVDMSDNRNPAQHGKCGADGASNVPVNELLKGVKRGDTLEPGTRPLVQYLASKRPRPADNNNQKHWWSHTKYLYCFVPEDGIKYDLVSAKKGYSGSSRDHQYFSVGSEMGDSEIICREKVCSCTPCLCGRPRECEFRRLVGNVRSVRIQPEPAAERRETRAGVGRGGRSSLDHFAQTIRRGDVVIVRVHAKDKNDMAETYYVAKAMTPAKQLTEKGIYSGNQ